MKKYFICLAFLIFSNSLFAQINNKIIIKVENQIVTEFEIRNKILSSLIISNEEINQNNIDRYKSGVLDTLIDNKLKKIEVERYKIKENNNKINSYLNSITQNIPALKKKFSSYDMDFQIFIDEISTEIKWRELIFKIYSKKIEIDNSSIEKEVEEIIKKESDIEELKISEIEILKSENENFDDKITEVTEQILVNGFEETALKYNSSYSASQKGDLGWINSKSLSKEIYEIVKKLKINEVSSPINRQGSIIFLKLNDKKVSKVDNLNINKIKNEVINQKKNEQFSLYSNSHLSKLKNTSTIEYK